VGGSYRLSGRAGIGGLAALHALVERVGRDHPELRASDLAMMETAVIEVVGNVVEHGTPPGAIGYDFCLEVTADHLHALLLETGDPVPMRARGDDQDLELAESGRGLAIARAVLSELRYERRGELNAWTLTRALSPGEDGGAGGG
jgi:serine/threonine-protein kinase RsbW